MSKFKRYQAICWAVALLLAGIGSIACAQSTAHASGGARSVTQPNNTGKVVMRVGNVQVTEGEFESLLGSMNSQQVQQSGGRHAIGENYANMLLLSQAALSQHLDSSPEFRQQMQEVRTNLLARLESQDIAQRLGVTPDEVNRYFTAHQPEFKEAKVYEVEVLKKTANNDKGLAEPDAQSKATAIRKALSSGADIKTVAKTYGVPNQVVVVTDPQPIPYKSTLPEFAKTAFTLPSGGVSEIENRPDALLFFQVVSHNQLGLKDATPQIENQLKQQKFEDAISSLKKQYPVWMDQSYFGHAETPETGGSH